MASDDLKRWNCYVDEIDDAHVHLVMADAAGGDERDIGSFPKSLFAHLSPVEGQFITVRVTADERLLIEEVALTDEDRARGAAQAAELVDLLSRLRDDAPDG